MRELIPFSNRSAFMRPVFDEFDDLFNKVFGESFIGSDKKSFPKLNIYNEGNKFIIEALVADVPKDKIKLCVEDNILTIEGESNQNRELNEDNYYVREISRRAFKRQIQLPDGLKDEGGSVKSNLKDGILKLEFEYKTENKPKNLKKIIEIE